MVSTPNPLGQSLTNHPTGHWTNPGSLQAQQQDVLHNAPWLPTPPNVTHHRWMQGRHRYPWDRTSKIQRLHEKPGTTLTNPNTTCSRRKESDGSTKEPERKGDWEADEHHGLDYFLNMDLNNNDGWDEYTNHATITSQNHKMINTTYKHQNCIKQNKAVKRYSCPATVPEERPTRKNDIEQRT